MLSMSQVHLSNIHMPSVAEGRRGGANTRHTLDGLLPELYPIVISHLPLHETPATLLALALANKAYLETVLPHLYRQVIVKSEEQAINVLTKLLESESEETGERLVGLGAAVHGLHVYTDLSLATRRGETSGDVVSLLARLIRSRHVPNLQSLSLHFQSGWYCDPVDWTPVKGYGVLGRQFWADLREVCPELREVTLGMVGDREDEEWLEESGIYELQELTSLQVSFRFWCPSIDGLTTFFNNITSPSLASSLQTLTLHNNIPTSDWITTTEILKCTFPRLEHINLQHLTRGSAAESMDFWKRHPTLRAIEIMLGGNGLGWYESDAQGDGEDDGAWFTADVKEDDGGWAAFLPSLKYLKTTYRDVRTLAPILGRLRGLYVTDSTNAQIPYLLRAVVPAGGLPALRSLGMHGKASAWRENESVEGALWYEDHESTSTEDGDKQECPFKQEVVKKGNRLTQNWGYVESIRKAAPNLEEIGLYNLLYPYDNVLPSLTSFGDLKRVFITGMRDPELHREFSLALGRASKTIESVTEIIDRSGPNPTFRVLRTEKGQVQIKKGTAFGMTIGHEADPFPSEL